VVVLQYFVLRGRSGAQKEADIEVGIEVSWHCHIESPSPITKDSKDTHTFLVACVVAFLGWRLAFGQAESNPRVLGTGQPSASGVLEVVRHLSAAGGEAPVTWVNLRQVSIASPSRVCFCS
jgi:hypothetical protein